jgi:hypothetical protein
MSGPFDDPEVKRLMRDNGIVHKPGLAADLLQEVAPLLAEEGIDINATADLDMATLNAALGRAVERRNLQNFTPVGATRAKTLTTLRLLAEAINDNNLALADAITNSVEPEPAGDAPSIAHLIGVSMGTLDAWYTGPALPNNLPTVQVPAWQKHAKAAATDVLALARKGRAFDSIGSLHGHHTGLTILHGGILAITGTLHSWATRDHTTVPDLAALVLTDS